MPILDWLNRSEAIDQTKDVPYRLLEEAADLSYGDKDSENILIQGDNLEALKALLPYYAGKVKCIYIDPPYNTKSAFEHYDDNVEHSVWLSMMYPRLELLRELLAEDGSLWVSIDDNEAHYLKVMMDEVFGRRNFISTICWEMIYTKKNSAKNFSAMHDFVFVYAKNYDNIVFNLLPRTEEQNKNFKNPDNDPRGRWIDSAMHGRNYYSKGTYTVNSPTGKNFTPPPGRYWTVSLENFERLDNENRIWWGKDGNNAPRKKTFITDVRQGIVPGTIWSYKDAGQNAEAKTEIKNLFANLADIFITPKPEKLIKQILTIATNEGDLILDSFLGSGTTAAVAQKMNRRWIGIEMGEHAVTHCVPRLKKVVDGEQGGISKAVNWEGGGGFRFYRLGQAVFDETGAVNTKIPYETLAAHVWFAETQTALKKVSDAPFLGEHGNTGYYLLYDGVLDNGQTVLTSRILRQLPKFEGPKVIYGEMSQVGDGRLRQQDITFKQIPYDLKAR